MKKIFSLFLSIIIVLSTFSTCFTAQALDTAGASGEVIITNMPDGEEKVEIKKQIDPDLKAELNEGKEEFEESSNFVEEKSTTYNASITNIVDIDGAAKLLRDSLANREDTITIFVTLENSVTEDCTEIFNRAKSEEYYTTPNTGDYISYQWQRFRYSYGMVDDTTFQMVAKAYYYTTKEEEQMVDNKVDEIIEDNNLRNLNQMDQVLTVYDYLCKNVTYDYDTLNDDTYYYKYSCYAALINKTAVCQGYALAFYRLCKELGIDNRIVTSDNHAWNIVNINGIYYNLDSTWDASYYSSKKRYAFLLKCPEHFDKDHVRQDKFTTEEFNTRYPMAADCYDHEKYTQCNHEYTYEYDSDNIHRNICSLCGADFKQNCQLNRTCTDATCIDDGNVFTKCSLCEKETSQNIPALGHDFGDWEVTIEATCTNDGTSERACTRCDKKESKTIQRVPHSFSDWTTKEPTCTEVGSKERACTNCGYVDKQEIPALGHKLKRLASVKVTCETDGKTAGYQCTVCNQIVVPQEIIPATGHNFQVSKVVEPTCTAKGYTLYVCSNCGYGYSDDFVAKLGHDYIQTDGVEPTCMQPGKTAGVKCSRCEEVLTVPEVIPATGHVYGSWITEIEPTCTETGSAYRICKNCDDTERVTILALGHEYSEWTEVSKASCTASGTSTKTCLRCSDTVSKIVPATGHSPEYVQGNAATCTSDGYKPYTVCLNCGEEIEKKVIIPATGHNYISAVTEPTCVEQGYTTYTCILCGDSYKTDYTDATNIHNYESAVIAPTCTEKGYTTHTCECGDSYVDNYVDATGHTYNTITTKATTGKNGSIVTKCSVCGVVKSKSTVFYPKTITLSTSSYVYNGKAKKPTVTVKGSNGKTISSTNYTVTYPSGRKNVGKYIVTIKFKGNYRGTVRKTFIIKPKATSISELTAKSKGFTVKWKKQATQTTGYQFQYSTYSNFKSPKTVAITKNSTISKTISKLNAEQKYYVRIRTYQIVKVNDKNIKIFSAWSKSKAVTTK